MHRTGSRQGKFLQVLRTRSLDGAHCWALWRFSNGTTLSEMKKGWSMGDRSELFDIWMGRDEDERGQCTISPVTSSRGRWSKRDRWPWISWIVCLCLCLCTEFMAPGTKVLCTWRCWSFLQSCWYTLKRYSAAFPTANTKYAGQCDCATRVQG